MAVTKFGERGLGEIRGLTFCEGTITDLPLNFPEFALLGVGDALDLEPVDQADT